MILHSTSRRATQARETPVRVLLTGANGGYGRTLLDQLRRLDDMVATQLVDPDVAGTTRMLDELGVPADRVATPSTVAETAAARGWDWDVELVDSPDAVLKASREIVATADSAILDRCGSWLNLARKVIESRCPTAWIIDLAS